MIKISSPEQQLRQNRTMLLLIGGISSITGLMLWSATPFAASNSRNSLHVSIRYFALVASLTCGVAAVATGTQLEKIKPLIRAIDMAERDDFLTQLAASQYVQQQQHEQAATAALHPAVQPGNSFGNEVVNSTPERVASDRDRAVTNGAPAETDTETDGETGSETEAYKPMYLAVVSLQQQGVSQSQIIKEILGQEGRNYEKGKAMLQTLLQLGKQQNW